MDTLMSFLSGLCLLAGALICVSGAVGVNRFDDFYTRMHAASVTDTLGAAFILIGLMLISDQFIVIAKLMIILLLGLIVGPTTSHVLAKAALKNGLKPNIPEQNRDDIRKK
jgi:multicomponent Na+:H+ antiporter subunit G